MESSYIKTRTDSAILDYLNDIDYPYWYNWDFCPPTFYAVGMKLNFVTGGVSMSCRSISGELRIIEIEGIQSENSEYGEEMGCEGLVIGFQVSLLDNRVQAVRLYCSGMDEAGNMSTVESEYERDPGASQNASWQERLMCGEQEAVCGYKLVDRKSKNHI